MITISGLSPNCAYLRLLQISQAHYWNIEPSRNGPYIDLGTVAVELDAGERIFFLEGRGFNPAFAVVEAAWILTGRNDLALPSRFISSFQKYSDDDSTLNGAYGHRLRYYFGFDQLDVAILELSKYPSSRRAVLSLYSPQDLGKKSEDIPCNTQVALRIVAGRLEMTVANRSNDLWLGVPYNWFTFWCIQRFVAHRLGISCGIQRHVSSCLHLYESNRTQAERVVARNTNETISTIEASSVPLDIDGLLYDVDRIVETTFETLTSGQLSSFFRRYQERSAAHAGGDTASGLREHERSILDASLDDWIRERPRAKGTDLLSTPLTSNPDTDTHLQLQRWVSSVSPAEAAHGVRIASARVVPLVHELIAATLPPGATVKFDGDAEQVAAMHVTLELILGCLDPELAQTHFGERLKSTLAVIAREAALPPKRFIPREMEAAQLGRIFEEALSKFEAA